MPFNPKTVELQGSNLIEASAGTGKTYSIAILVLRLLMEKNIPIQEILMVTFTKAAVAELELRVRAFIRQAVKASRGEHISDQTISTLVEDCSMRLGREVVAKRLQDAQLMLDETAVLTIHGFCQRTLGEYAFETGQLFGAETIGPDEFNELTQDSFHEFWRQQISVIDPELLTILLMAGLDRKEVMRMTEAAAQGKNIRSSVPIPAGFLSPTYQQDLLELIRNNEQDRDEKIPVIITHICMLAVDWVKADVSRAKQVRGFITYDDMILLLHQAVMEGSHKEALAERMQQKYKAVFIDEFQDTDREQYDIFNTLFARKQILFYIGDPKQSIYAWRKADIFTYFKARAEVDFLHEMNVNHRSSEAMIDAMNHFFKPTADFDTFYFNNAAESITYIPVESPQPNSKGELLYNGQPMTPIRLTKEKKKKYLLTAIRSIISELLFSDNYTIRKPGETDRKVKPSDIGVLVRSNREGKKIRELLALDRIASITIDDTKLLQSIQARELSFVMEAVLHTTRQHIHRALLTEIGGYDKNSLLIADEEAILQRFKTYQDTWNARGVYEMLRQFLSDHGLEDRLMAIDSGMERTVSNLLQIVELIHKISERKNYDPREQIQWLKRGLDGELREGDEYEQRIESDDDAVRIVTIHKSKGLEYNIVIAPHLDSLMPEPKKINQFSFRDPQSGKYYVVDKRFRTPQEKTWCEEQNEQENRRLFYVAITRARLACFITAHMWSGYNKSTLRTFINAIADAGGSIPGVEDFEPGELIARPQPAAGAALPARQVAVAQDFRLDNLNWKRTSYTGLNPAHDGVASEYDPARVLDDYDQFMFRQLRKGAHTGNLLHFIFENINFTDDSHWKAVTEKALKRLSGKTDEAYAEQIVNMLQQVIHAELIPGSGLTLHQIHWHKRLNELEFDIPLRPFQTDTIQQLSTPEIPLQLRTERDLEGILNGKMDLFFEYEGRYYILDWKSNHLGDRLENYEPQYLGEAMAANNYHLQYHLYTVAATKFLSLRIPGFNYARDFGGVCYLFLRGVRKGKTNGIFFHKPDENTVFAMRSLLDPMPVG